MDSKNRDTTALIARRCKPILSQLKICCQDHGKSCNGDVLGLGEDDVEINLIDVRRMCLVQRNSATCGYFTLSYVWGGVEQYRLSKSNLDFLHQEASFNAIIQNIPQVARDAIQLVRGLKGTYLWIDSLCIIQDDAEQKHHQIAHMAQIYSRSFLTIVAAEAQDANSGLPCVHYTDATRSETYPGMEAPIDDSHLEQVLRSSKFGSRAWTYQEILLSRRRLFSYTNRTILQCGTGSWYSGLSNEWELSPNNTDRPLFPLPRLAMASGLSWVLSYQWIVESYTCKDLSFASDIWPAFSGIESALVSLFKCRFYRGLPVCFFDYALLWAPHSQSTSSKRRVSKPQFPSWSWMGWESRVFFPRHVAGDFRVNVIWDPLVSSMVIVSQEGSQVVNPKFQESVYPNSLLGFFRNLPVGDSSIEPCDGMISTLKADAMLHFYAFTTPVHFLEEGLNKMYAGTVCLLSKVFLSKEGQLTNYKQAPLGRLINVDLEDLEDVARSQRPLEIVALSVCYGLTWENDAPLWDMVNVLLIQWFDGYAERVAVGQLRLHAWISYCNRVEKHIKLS